MACFWLKSQESSIKIPTVVEIDRVIHYKILVTVGEISWTVTHRYKDFYDLNTKLVNDHGVSKDLLPSKKLIGTKCPDFIETRRNGLEIYLFKVLKFLRLTMPQIYVEFLHFDLYDSVFLLQKLALKFYSEAGSSPSLKSSYTFNVLEMHSIGIFNDILFPIENNPDKRLDFTHVLDLCSQLETLQINGLIGDYMQSNIKPNYLIYGFKHFKKVNILSMKEVNLDSINDLGFLRKNLKHLTIIKSKMANLSQILQCDVLHKYTFDNTQIWSNLMLLDLSCNCLTEIDQTINLIPNLQILILDQNRFSSIPNLQKLEKLRSLSICGNLITSCQQINVLLGKILHLNLSQNSIKSLEGLENLYSLKSLNLTGNQIKNIEDLRFLWNLPCLEDLKLTGNDVSTIVDYRVKVLEYFGKKAEDICLDNEQTSQSEIDKVSIRRALKLLKGDIKNTESRT